jgi:acetyl-CoA acyltransferase
MIVASEEAARVYGLTPRARVVAGSVERALPLEMGIGPVPAIRQLLSRTGYSLEQLDAIELNEGFVAQGLVVFSLIGIADDDPRLDANGGPIALGYPLGMSGARLDATAVNQMQHGAARLLLCTM